ncbi:MAG: hypothetical protein AAF750_03435 [Planctomycetota bacterium]
MLFSTDRDLLLYEPQLFNDVPWLAQQRVNVTDAEFDSQDPTVVSSIDADFTAAAVDPSSIVLIDRTPHEVVTRQDSNTLTVSLPRARTTDPAVPPTLTGPNHTLQARTFAPQAQLVHDELLTLLGMAPDDPTHGLTDENVISLTTAARLETLGTLQRIYAAAAAITENHEPFFARAERYRRAYQHALRTSTLLIDTNHDGYPEHRRSPAITHLRRA